MIGKVLSIEVGLSTTKIVELNCSKKQNTICNIIEIDTPEGTLSNQGLYEIETLAFLIRKELKDAKIKTKRAIFVINSDMIQARQIVIPKQNNTLQYLELVREKAIDDNVFPIDIKGNVIAYSKLCDTVKEIEVQQKNNSKNKKQKDLKEKDKEVKPKKKKITETTTMAFIAPEELINSYIDLARLCKLNLVSIEYAGNSVYNYVINRDEAQNYIITHITDTNCIMTTVHNGIVIEQRTTEYSYSSFASRILEKAHLFGDIKELDEVFNYINENDFLNTEKDHLEDSELDELDQEDIARIKDETIESFFSLFDQINSFIGQYRNTYNENLDKLIYISERKSFPDITDSIEANTGVETVQYKVMDKAYEKEDLTYYINCLGAVYNPVNFNIIDSQNRKKKMYADRAILGMVVATAGVCLSVVMFNLVQLSNYLIKNADLNSKIAEATEAQRAYNTYKDSETAYNEIKEFDDGNITNLNKLGYILDDIEGVMPTGRVEISGISLSNEQIVLTVTATDKDSIGYMLDGLEKLSWFQKYDETGAEVGIGVDIGNVTDTYGTGTSGRAVQASITCGFTGALKQEEQTTDSTEGSESGTSIDASSSADDTAGDTQSEAEAAASELVY